MKPLSQLPNIGKTLEQKLISAGINSPEELRSIGAEQAFLRLSIENKSACFNLLCAIEGAVQGIRWHSLSKERKNELKNFLKLMEISE